MQAIKEKLNDMRAMRKAKAEAKEEENEEKEIAKARVEVAHEVRMAREAEAAMDLHVNKAAEKAAEFDRRHPHRRQDISGGEENYSSEYSYGTLVPNNSPDHPTYGGADGAVHGGRDTRNIDSAAAGTGYSGNVSGGPPTNNLL